MNSEERQMMPSSPNSEDALIGAIILDPELAKTIAVDPADLYYERSRWIWEAFQAIQARGIQPDLLTICAELDAKKRLAEVGGQSWLLGLLSNTMFGSNVAGYAAIIKDKAARRRTIRLANELATAAFDQGSDITAAISKAMDGLGRSVVVNRGAVHISEYGSQVWDDIEAAVKNPCDVFGIPTGFPDWDRIAGGLQKKEVVKVTGVPGIGKSLWMVQVMMNAARAGHPGAIYSPEMSAAATFKRGLSALSKIDTKCFRTGRLGENQLADLISAFDQMSQLPLYISDASDFSTTDLRVDLNRLKNQAGVELVLIDYEALLNDGADVISNETERSMLISGRVKGIIKDLDLACLSVGDMIKSGVSGATTGQAALAGSARILYNADQILIMRPNPDNKNQVIVTWEKNREGVNNRGLVLQKAIGFPAFESPAEVKNNAQRMGTKS